VDCIRIDGYCRPVLGQAAEEAYAPKWSEQVDSHLLNCMHGARRNDGVGSESISQGEDSFLDVFIVRIDDSIGSNRQGLLQAMTQRFDGDYPTSATDLREHDVHQTDRACAEDDDRFTELDVYGPVATYGARQRFDECGVLDRHLFRQGYHTSLHDAAKGYADELRVGPVYVDAVSRIVRAHVG
jgi:hypothetical protein